MQPIRITFDNNFIDELGKATPEQRAHILCCVKDGQLEVYGCELVLMELMGMAGTGKEPRLPRNCRQVLDWTQGRMLAKPQNVLESELNGRPEFVLDALSRDRLVEYLTHTADIAVQKSAADIGKKALAEKAIAVTELRKYIPVLENRPDGLTDQQWNAKRESRKAKRKRTTFEDVWEVWARKNARAHLDMNYTQWGVSNPAETADRVLNSLESLPRHAAWLVSHAIPAYYYGLLGEPVDDGDLFDHRLLVYGHDLDVFLTNDGRLKAWFHLVYGDTCRVLTSAEFFATKWC